MMGSNDVTSTDETRIEEIHKHFDSHGYELLTKQLPDGTWSAPYALMQEQGGSRPFGAGKTELEATEDALLKFNAAAPPPG